MLLTYQAFYLTLRFGQVVLLAQDALVIDGPIPHCVPEPMPVSELQSVVASVKMVGISPMRIRIS